MYICALKRKNTKHKFYYYILNISVLQNNVDVFFQNCKNSKIIITRARGYTRTIYWQGIIWLGLAAVIEFKLWTCDMWVTRTHVRIFFNKSTQRKHLKKPHTLTLINSSILPPTPTPSRRYAAALPPGEYKFLLYT